MKDKIKVFLKENIHYFFIACMLLIIIAGTMILKNHQQGYVTEEWVRDYLQAYSNSLSDLDIQILSKNISAQIDEKIGELNFDKSLEPDQMMELLMLVNKELQYADFSISEDDIEGITVDMVKQIMKENLTADYATSHKIDKDIEELNQQLAALKSALEVQKDTFLSAEQIKEVAQEVCVDEDTVRKWIENYSDSSSNNDDVINELARMLDVDAQTLQEMTDKAAQTDDSIEYLINRLGITEDKLNNALKELNTSDTTRLTELAAQLNVTEADLQKQINDNMSLVMNSISSVQQQVSNNRSATDSAIAANKQEVLSTMAANKKETDKQIQSNKEYTDTAIEELQENVLYYEYDETTSTLKLFKKPEGEGGSENEKNN